MRPDMLTHFELDSLPRKELVEQARQLGVERPERMTRVELRDELVRRSLPPEKQAEARGLFGVARSMIASVVESGLNLPDAAKAIRGEGTADVPMSSQTPVATVTLAEIYAAQGHRARALRMIEEVLAAEPDHEEAERVRRDLLGTTSPTSDSGQHLGTPPSEVPISSPAVATIPDDRPFPMPSAVAPRSAAELPDAVLAEHPGSSEQDAPDTTFADPAILDTVGEEVETGRPPSVATRPEDEVASGTSESLAAPSWPGPSQAMEVPTELPIVESPPALASEPSAPAEPSEPFTPAEPSNRLESSEPSAPAASLEPAEWTQHSPPPPPDDSVEALDALQDSPRDVPGDRDASPEPEAVAEPLRSILGVASLVIAQAETEVSLYWEVPSALTSQHLGQGQLVLLVVAFLPCGTTPARLDRRFPLVVEPTEGLASGVVRLDELTGRHAVRATLGWEQDDSFQPWTLGRTLEECAVDSQSRRLLERATRQL